jgi:hypothetical protein
LRFILAAVAASRSGSSGSGGSSGRPQSTYQYRQARVQVSPTIWNLSVPRPQQSAMFGQRASSQIVFNEAPWISLRTSKYAESALGARTFIQSGRRGRSATGSDSSMALSLETEQA